jgi:hypothetical protein
MSLQIYDSKTTDLRYEKVVGHAYDMTVGKPQLLMPSHYIQKQPELSNPSFPTYKQFSDRTVVLVLACNRPSVVRSLESIFR